MKICSVCGSKKMALEFGEDLRNTDKLKSVCKFCNSAKEKERRAKLKQKRAADDLPDSEGYDASCIKILHEPEIFERMPWLEAETLAHQYGKDVGFIRRGLKACRLAGVGEQYFIRRYLQEEKSIPMNVAVDYQSRVIQGLVGGAGG